MTASPVDAKVDVEKAARYAFDSAVERPLTIARELETLLHSQIATASDLALLRQFVNRPAEEVWTYDSLPTAFETPLYQELNMLFGDMWDLRKLFRFAKEATSTLGSWCSDFVWSQGLEEEQARKLQARVERKLQEGSKPTALIDEDNERIETAKELVKHHKFEELESTTRHLSSKVLLLLERLNRYFEMPTGTKCIVFVKERHTARILKTIFERIGTEFLHPGVLIGIRKTEPGDMSQSVRDQTLTILNFRTRKLNCLVGPC